LLKALTELLSFWDGKEFVVSFLLMAFIGSLPNLFVGVSSALHNIPELSFGEVIGGNLINVTLAIALASYSLKWYTSKK
jgi:Ca2+/Na+ antiporter